MYLQHNYQFSSFEIIIKKFKIQHTINIQIITCFYVIILLTQHI